MNSPDTFTALMARLRAGDEQACAVVFDRFASQVIHLANLHLPASLRRKLDPDDVLQSVFRTFFVRQRDGRLDPVNWDNLWGLLMVITQRKCGRHTAYFRSARREMALDPAAEERARGTANDPPNPLEAALLADTLAALMSGCDPGEQQIIALHLEAWTIFEISAQVGRSARTVRRVLERVRNRLRRLNESDDAGAEPPAAGGDA